MRDCILEVIELRAAWMDDELCRLVLTAMMPPNRLALEVSDATGLRIDDVLALHTEDVKRTQRPYVVDSKTGKTHRIYIPAELRERMLQQAGSVWVWPGRLKPKIQHRTRQAVYKDMIQAVDIYRRNGTADRHISISPHTMRKRAAVRAYHKGGFEAAQRKLVHDEDHELVTLIYALADKPELLPKPHKRRKKTGGRKSGGQNRRK